MKIMLKRSDVSLMFSNLWELTENFCIQPWDQIKTDITDSIHHCKWQLLNKMMHGLVNYNIFFWRVNQNYGNCCSKLDILRTITRIIQFAYKIVQTLMTFSQVPNKTRSASEWKYLNLIIYNNSINDSTFHISHISNFFSINNHLPSFYATKLFHYSIYSM